MTTFGAESYPVPPSTTEIELIVPPVDTTDVAVAPSFTTWDVKVTWSWNVRPISLSFWESNIGLTLST